MNNSTSSMSTPINNIPIKTNNLEEINDPTIENIFKDFKNNNVETNNNNINQEDLKLQEQMLYEQQLQQQKIQEEKIKEQMLYEQQIKQNMENKNKSINPIEIKKTGNCLP